MPQFFFNIINGKSIPDEEGSELPDLAAAHEEALEPIAQIMKDRILDVDQQHRELSAIIRDDAGDQAKVSLSLRVEALR
jgi:hypothetical protein